MTTQHELRMTIGQNSMAIADALDTKVVLRVVEAYTPTVKAYRRLIKNGLTPTQATALMVGLLLGALDNETDDQ